MQGAFGALTVTMKLQPAIVTLHLLGGLVLLALLVSQAVSYEHAQSQREPVPASAGMRAAVAAVSGGGAGGRARCGRGGAGGYVFHVVSVS